MNKTEKNKELPMGFYVATIVFGVMIILDAFGISKAPLFAYIYCGVAAIFFIVEGGI